MAMIDDIDELESFYGENHTQLTYVGADENPEKFIEYENRVSEFVSDLYDTVQEEVDGSYAEKAAEMLAERVEEELRTPFGSPGEGSKSPNFDKARKLLGE